MYYPYFRGKQNELILIRECAQLLKEAGFIPVIEPVKEVLGGLKKSLSAIREVEGKAIVIINPSVGYFADQPNNSISDFLQEDFEDYSDISYGILLTEELSAKHVEGYCNDFEGKQITFVHAGFTEAKLLTDKFGEVINNITHIFYEQNCGKLYQKRFKDANRILLRDGFKKCNNRDYPDVEFFSDLHATYIDENMNGFGDFLTVGDIYNETGGPAYAIAIHLTFIDDDKDDEMHIYHFKSIRQDDPKDPAGKFAEALDKMMEELDQPENKILETYAIKEFKSLHERGHFPGLGYVKKLSMMHHVETLAHYFKNVNG